MFLDGPQGLFLLEGLPLNFHSTTVRMPFGSRTIARHSITSASAQPAVVQPWFTPEVVHLRDVPSGGQAIRLHTGGRGGNMHFVLPFHTANDQLLAAVYSLKQQRLTIGVCGSRLNRHAAFEPWVVRQDASIAVKYAHGESPYYTSPIEGMDQLVHPATFKILRDGIATHRLLVQFPTDLRREILRRLQACSDDTPTRLEGLRLLAACLKDRGPAAVWRMIERVEAVAVTDQADATAPMPMYVDPRSTVAVPLEGFVPNGDAEPPGPEAITIPGDLPTDWADDTAFSTVRMGLGNSRRASGIMGSGTAPAVSAE